MKTSFIKKICKVPVCKAESTNYFKRARMIISAVSKENGRNVIDAVHNNQHDRVALPTQPSSQAKGINGYIKVKTGRAGKP